MKIYFNTYNFILDKLKQLNGNYLIHNESCVTDNIHENNVQVVFFDRKADRFYELDRYRVLNDVYHRYGGRYLLLEEYNEFKSKEYIDALPPWKFKMEQKRH